MTYKLKYYILFLLSINVLLPQNPSTLLPKLRSNSRKGNPPALPSKRYGYVIPDDYKIMKPQSIVYRTVKLYTSRIGMTFFECNGVTFSDKAQAERYCNLLNKHELSKVKHKYWDNMSTITKHRNSLLRSNTDLSDKKRPISRHIDSLTERKHSFSGPRNSLLGLRRSSSSQSLIQSNNHLSLRRNGVSGSNNALWPKRHSVSRSTKDSLSRRNSISVSTGDSSGIKNSLPTLRENLNNKLIGNEINEEFYDKKIKKKTKSYQIWLKVWKHCNFECISENYYDGYRQHALLEINMYRLHHKVNILEFSTKLAEIAQELVEKYLMTQTLDVKLYPNYGILYGKSTIISASKIIKNFYETKTKYSFNFNKPNSEAAYSFAQIVWKSTTQLGIGVQHDNGYLFVVCVFYPKGNKKKEYGKNVYKWIG